MSAFPDVYEDFMNSAEYKNIRAFVLNSDRSIVIAKESMARDIPFTARELTRFCNMMISICGDSMVRREDGITVVGDGVQVSTARYAGGMMYSLQKADLKLDL